MDEAFYTDPEVCQVILLDYAKNPRHAGRCEGETHAAEGMNPACGDVVKMGFRVEGERLVQARIAGAGCAVSQASAGLLAQELEGKTMQAAREILREMGSLLAGDAVKSGVLGQLLVLRMITGNPARVRCARVALEVAVEALGEAR